jgi:hypothetical protein
MRRRQFIGLIGGMVAWPTAGRTPQRMPHIAIVHPSDPVSTLNATGGVRWRAFFAELKRLGLSEGKNLQVERYSGEGRSDVWQGLSVMQSTDNTRWREKRSQTMVRSLQLAYRRCVVESITGALQEKPEGSAPL